MSIDLNIVYAVDLSMVGTIRVVGADAPRFVRTMYSGNMEHFDELFGVSQGMLLNSEGQVVDMVGVIRTGDDECLIMTATENLSEDLMWLNAHAELEDDKGRIFPDVTVEDQSMKLAVMLMYGPKSEVVYGELEEACKDKVFMIHCRFDSTTYAVPMGPGHLMIMAPQAAPEVGKFINQRLDVEFLRLGEYSEQLRESGQIRESLTDAAYQTPNDLGLSGYLRDVHDFVGARALGLE